VEEKEKSQKKPKQNPASIVCELYITSPPPLPAVFYLTPSFNGTACSDLRKDCRAISRVDLPHLQSQPEQKTPVPGEEGGAGGQEPRGTALAVELLEGHVSWDRGPHVMKPGRGDAVG